MKASELDLPDARPPGSYEPDPDEAARPRGTSKALLTRPWFFPAAVTVSGIVLFLAYLQQARTFPTVSDGASQALQAWDMLHGNLLLRGWSLSDVSFYTTELPQYMLVEIVRGFNADVVHVAAALTYALLVLAAGLLARGRATGRDGLVRMLIAAGIMVAPPLGASTRLLMSYPDHTGTQVPLLVTWLVLDRAGPRWWVAAAVAALLAWAQVADTLVLYEGVLPLLGVCAVRMFRRGGRLAGQWYELALSGGAIASVVAATVTLRLIRLAGGFAVRTPEPGFASVRLISRQIWPKLEHVLQLFGADFTGMSAKGAVIPLIHLVGLALVVWAVTHAVRRFYAQDDLVVQVLTAAFMLVLMAYLLGSREGGWEAVGLLPAGAVLAGRLVPARLPASSPMSRRVELVLAAVLACYGLVLLHSATKPEAFNANLPVATWLEAHHMKYGLAEYWDASSITLETGNRVQVRPVRWAHGAVELTHWEAARSWYDPHLHDARFVITRARCTGCTNLARLSRIFGPPAAVYRISGYLVLTWNKNLLTGPIVSGPPVRWNILAAGWPGPSLTEPTRVRGTVRLGKARPG